MSTRLSNEEELDALHLLEAALEIAPDDPASHIHDAGSQSREVRERALRLLSASQAADSVALTGGASAHGLPEEEPELPQHIGAYRAVSLLGRGGMGAVYKGERVDADFEHDVAIKVIRPSIVSDALAERFRRERRILASLRHPNIAQLYDGGETSDGAPYIVMEFVEGLSVSRWLRKTQPDLPMRLALFTQICGAVEFAHQNLIVHRDLTPGNVLVDERGQAKLIDFGIARPQDDADAQPQSPLSQLSLTPGFAAPERKLGGPVTTLADIYSLGRILEILIEGREEPELAAIADKAKRDDPAQRYGSAALLERDIANFRDGLPIAAFSNDRLYRMRKYITRHRVPVALTGVAAALLIGGLVTVTDAWRDEARAHANAEQRFNEVRALSNFLLFDLYDELEGVPGTTKALNDIADRARQYLDVLSATQGSPAGVRLEAALAYKRLSDVLGTPLGANLGRREEAGETIAMAITQLRSLYTEAPEDPAIQEGLAEALYSQAVFAFIALDDNELAHETASEAAAIYWQLAEDEGREAFEAKAIDAEIEAAIPLAWIGRGDDAAKMLKQTLTKTEEHIDTFGQDASRLNLLARINSNLAETLGRVEDGDDKQYAEALRYADASIAAYEDSQKLSEKPDGIERSMAIGLYKRSLLLYSLDQWSRALSDLDRAIEMIEKMSALDPEDAGLDRTLSVLREQKAITLAHAGKADAAIALALRSTQAKRDLLAASPTSGGAFRDLASNLALTGEVAEVGERNQQACRLYGESKDMFDDLEERGELSEYDRDVVRGDLEGAITRTC